MAARSIYIDAIQKPAQLFARQLADALLPARPYEVVFFEAPQHYAETVAIVEQQIEPFAFVPAGTPTPVRAAAFPSSFPWYVRSGNRPAF